MKTKMAICLITLLVVVVGRAGLTASVVAQSDALCPPLPAPTGNVVHVSTVAELQDAMSNLTPNTTILLADGTYDLHGAFLWFGAPGVTMRSASGNREAVILDGNYETDEIALVAASDVTIADLTLKRAIYHPIHVVATDDADTENTLIYNVHVMDPGQQAIKINQNSAMTHFPDYGVVACSHVELTDEGRPHVWDINNSCYTGGVDGHQARGWVIRDNVIEGFWCEHDLAEHGIHFWTGSRDTLVERNTLINNARGIGFGLGQSGDQRVYGNNPCPGADYVGHSGGTVRNNFIFASRDALFFSESGFDCGICLEQACGTQVLHNTVASTGAPFSSIEWRWPNTNVEITNNLLSHNLRERDGAIASLAGNLENAPLSLFVDGAGGDLHLAAGASVVIDQGLAFADGLCDDDVDGGPRPMGPAPDVGADEYGSLPPAVTEPTASPTAISLPATATLTSAPTATSPPPTATPMASPTATGTPTTGQYTIVFQQGISPDPSYAGTTDVILANDVESNVNLGGVGHVETYFGDAEYRRSLVRWDLSALSSDTTIDAASLELYRYGGSDEPEDMEVALYLVTHDWSEGDGSDFWPDSSYVPDGATWLTADGSAAWTTPGGDHDTTTDYGYGPNGIVDQITLPTGMEEGWVRLDATAAVRAWIEEGVPNHGLLFRPEKGEYTYHYYYSRDHDTPNLRPRLVVTYTVGGTVTPEPTRTEQAWPTSVPSPATKDETPEPESPTPTPGEEVTAATATEAPVAAAPTSPSTPAAPPKEEGEGGGLCPASIGLALAGLVLIGRGVAKMDW